MEQYPMINFLEKFNLHIDWFLIRGYLRLLSSNQWLPSGTTITTYTTIWFKIFRFKNVVKYGLPKLDPEGPIEFFIVDADSNSDRAKWERAQNRHATKTLSKSKRTPPEGYKSDGSLVDVEMERYLKKKNEKK